MSSPKMKLFCYKLSNIGQDGGKKILVNQDRKATTFNLILVTQPLNFYHSFYNTLGIFSPKIDAKSVVGIF